MLLRELEIGDLEFLLNVRNHPSTRVWLENKREFTLDECREWFKKLEDKWYIIEVNSVPVGYIRTSNETDESICMGCDIHPQFRRKGYATEAYKQIIEKYKNKSIYLWVFKINPAVKLYEKLGFKATGESKLIRNMNYIRMELWNSFEC